MIHRSVSVAYLIFCTRYDGIVDIILCACRCLFERLALSKQ